MSSRRFLFVVDAPPHPPQIALRAEFAICCVDLATVRVATTDQNGELIELTSDQWQFLRGVYAMNLEGPPGLPYGGNAVLAQGRGDSNGLLFFVDRDKPCAPMHAPPALRSLMEQVAIAETNHENVGRP